MVVAVIVDSIVRPAPVEGVVEISGRGRGRRGARVAGQVVDCIVRVVDSIVRAYWSRATSQVEVVDSIVRLPTSRWCRPIGRSGQLRVRTGVVVVVGTWSTSRVCGRVIVVLAIAR